MHKLSVTPVITTWAECVRCNREFHAATLQGIREDINDHMAENHNGRSVLSCFPFIEKRSRNRTIGKFLWAG